MIGGGPYQLMLGGKSKLRLRALKMLKKSMSPQSLPPWDHMSLTNTGLHSKGITHIMETDQHYRSTILSDLEIAILLLEAPTTEQ